MPRILPQFAREKITITTATLELESRLIAPRVEFGQASDQESDIHLAGHLLDHDDAACRLAYRCDLTEASRGEDGESEIQEVQPFDQALGALFGDLEVLKAESRDEMVIETA